MGFVVEDGTGLPDANSYGAVAEADAYFADRKNKTWIALDAPAKETALIQATDYMDQKYTGRYIGKKNAAQPDPDDPTIAVNQALEWPRTNAAAFKNDKIPLKLQQACFEYAVRASAASLLPDPIVDANGVMLVTVKSDVGPLKTEKKIVGGSMYSPPVFLSYPSADALMRTLVYPSNYVFR